MKKKFLFGLMVFIMLFVGTTAYAATHYGLHGNKKWVRSNEHWQLYYTGEAFTTKGYRGSTITY